MFKKTIKYKHVYQTNALYQLAFGHFTAHVAMEVATMQQIIDRLDTTKSKGLTVLELGAGTTSRYRDLWQSQAPENTDKTFGKYTISDAESGFEWDFMSEPPASQAADFVLMPYYLHTSLVDFKTFKPMKDKIMPGVYANIMKLVRPGGHLIMHAVNFHKPTWWEDSRRDVFSKVPFKLLKELNGLMGIDANYKDLYATIYHHEYQTPTHFHDQIEKIVVTGMRNVEGGTTEEFEVTFVFSNSSIGYRKTNVLDFFPAAGIDLKDVRRFNASQDCEADSMCTEVKKVTNSPAVHNWLSIRRPL